MCNNILQYDLDVDTKYIYIHWPFCPYRCHFCPFVTVTGLDQYKETYHKALLKEMVKFGDEYRGSRKIDTIFIGGGTPSTYPNELLLDMSVTLRDIFSINENLEFSIEVNPGTVKKDQLPLWKSIGINRLSIGVQSLNDGALQKLNRHQSAQDVYNLLDIAAPYFDNISVDVIVGLPGVSNDDWQQLIKELTQWPIKHVSMYFLAIHENTQLYRGIKTQKFKIPKDDGVVEQYYWAANMLKENGFEQYEVSSFAKLGYQSKHNSAYWQREPYKAFGVGACSFDGKIRFQNEKNFLKYMKQVNANCFPVGFAEQLDKKQELLEKLMLGMRQSKGVLLAELFQFLSLDEKEKFLNKIKDLDKAGYVLLQGDRLSLTPLGFSIENEIVVRLTT